MAGEMSGGAGERASPVGFAWLSKIRQARRGRRFGILVRVVVAQLVLQISAITLFLVAWLATALLRAWWQPASRVVCSLAQRRIAARRVTDVLLAACDRCRILSASR